MKYENRIFYCLSRDKVSLWEFGLRQLVLASSHSKGVHPTDDLGLAES